MGSNLGTEVLQTRDVQVFVQQSWRAEITDLHYFVHMQD
jgi:hypothetical protein